MTVSAFLALIPLLFGMASAERGARPSQARAFAAQNEMILRVPIRPLPAPRFDWEERKGPKCVPTTAIRGALLSGPDHVDLMLPQSQRIRATFDDDCPALDFYAGFYLKTEDERVCAGRDSVHSRIGGSCRIKRFRHLVPKFKR